MSKFTAGPWHSHETPESSNQDFTVRCGRETICSVDFGPHEEANSHLIAAAPDLYAALESIDKFCDEQTHFKTEEWRFWLRCRDMAREALAKAGGEA